MSSHSYNEDGGYYYNNDEGSSPHSFYHSDSKYYRSPHPVQPGSAYHRHFCDSPLPPQQRQNNVFYRNTSHRVYDDYRVPKRKTHTDDATSYIKKIPRKSKRSKKIMDDGRIFIDEITNDSSSFDKESQYEKEEGEVTEDRGYGTDESIGAYPNDKLEIDLNCDNEDEEIDKRKEHTAPDQKTGIFDEIENIKKKINALQHERNSILESIMEMKMKSGVERVNYGMTHLESMIMAYIYVMNKKK